MGIDGGHDTRAVISCTMSRNLTMDEITTRFYLHYYFNN
jgi:hypothetical protein